MKRYGKWIAVLGVNIVLGALLSLMVMIDNDPEGKLNLLDAGVRTDDSGARVVTGTARNDTHHSLARVEMEIHFLGDNDTMMGATVASTSDLDPGETWDFEAPVLAKGAARFRIGNMDCRPAEPSSEWARRKACAVTFEGVIPQR